MNAKKFVSSWLAVFVVIFVLSSLWHVVLMKNFYAGQTETLAREESQVLFVIIGLLVLTLLMTIIYPIGYKGGSPVKEGLRFGVLIGLIWILPWSLIIHGIWNYPLTCVIVDSAWHIIEEGIGGIVIGLVYGTGIAEATT